MSVTEQQPEIARAMIFTQTQLGGDPMIYPKKADNFTPLTMEEFDAEAYLYDEQGLHTLEEQEGINPEDAAFMQGYLSA